MVIAAICQYNGGGIREAKYAVPDDGKIDLIVAPAMRIPKVLKHMKDMTSGDHIDKIKEIRMTLTTQAEIHSDQLLRAETEGELLKVGDYHIKLIPNSLNVLTAISFSQQTA
jgi:diacylglycerol kinase family enzyme